MIKRKDGELKEGESIGGFFIKLVISLVAVIIVATIVPDVLGVNVQELCIEEDTILGGITANHCGDDSVFLTDAVKGIIGDGYSFLLVGIALAFIGIGAYKGVTYKVLSVPMFGSKKESTEVVPAVAA